MSVVKLLRIIECCTDADDALGSLKSLAAATRGTGSGAEDAQAACTGSNAVKMLATKFVQGYLVSKTLDVKTIQCLALACECLHNMTFGNSEHVKRAVDDVAQGCYLIHVWSLLDHMQLAVSDVSSVSSVSSVSADPNCIFAAIFAQTSSHLMNVLANCNCFDETNPFELQVVNRLAAANPKRCSDESYEACCRFFAMYFFKSSTSKSIGLGSAAVVVSSWLLETHQLRQADYVLHALAAALTCMHTVDQNKVHASLHQDLAFAGLVACAAKVKRGLGDCQLGKHALLYQGMWQVLSTFKSVPPNVVLTINTRINAAELVWNALSMFGCNEGTKKHAASSEMIMKVQGEQGVRGVRGVLQRWMFAPSPSFFGIQRTYEQVYDDFMTLATCVANVVASSANLGHDVPELTMLLVQVVRLSQVFFDFKRDQDVELVVLNSIVERSSKLLMMMLASTRALNRLAHAVGSYEQVRKFMQQDARMCFGLYSRTITELVEAAKQGKLNETSVSCLQELTEQFCVVCRVFSEQKFESAAKFFCYLLDQDAVLTASTSYAVAKALEAHLQVKAPYGIPACVLMKLDICPRLLRHVAMTTTNSIASKMTFDMSEVCLRAVKRVHHIIKQAIWQFAQIMASVHEYSPECAGEMTRQEYTDHVKQKLQNCQVACNDISDKLCAFAKATLTIQAALTNVSQSDAAAQAQRPTRLSFGVNDVADGSDFRANVIGMVVEAVTDMIRCNFERPQATTATTAATAATAARTVKAERTAKAAKAAKAIANSASNCAAHNVTDLCWCAMQGLRLFPMNSLKLLQHRVCISALQLKKHLDLLDTPAAVSEFAFLLVSSLASDLTVVAKQKACVVLVDCLNQATCSKTTLVDTSRFPEVFQTLSSSLAKCTQAEMSCLQLAADIFDVIDAFVNNSLRSCGDQIELVRKELEVLLSKVAGQTSLQARIISMLSTATQLHIQTPAEKSL